MSVPGFEVQILNPRKKTRRKAKGKKKMAKRDSKGRYLPKAGGKRRKKRRRNNPSGSGGGGGRSRRRRRRNPEGGGGSLTIASATKDWWPKFLGKLFVAYAVRRWGGQGSVWPGAGQMMSPLAGRSWTLWNYIVGYLALRVVAGFLSKGGRAAFGAQFFRGGFDLLLTKAVWTEGFARSTWLQEQFGQHYAPLGQADGAVTYDQSGQGWMMMDGQWQALQGMGQLVTAGPLDGRMGQLVTAGPLDGYGFGQLVTAGPLDDYMGHQMPRGTSTAEGINAAYQQTGGTDPYATAYMT